MTQIDVGLLADQIESAIHITIRRRNEIGRVVSENLMPHHRTQIVAALRSSPPPTAGREEIAKVIQENPWTTFPEKESLELADAILRRPPSPSAEPVAWRLRHNSSSRWEYRDEQPNGPSVHLFDVEPLYASPPVSDASRETLEAIIKASRECVRDYYVASGIVHTAEGDGYGALRALRLALEIYDTAALAKPFDNAGDGK